MKRMRKGIIALFLVCAAILWQADVTEAKALPHNKAYSVDLNSDGSKEKVKWIEKGTDDQCSVKLYVNGKKLASVTSDYALTAEVSVVDIDKDDQYKEIYVQFTAESECFNKSICYRYQGGKLKKYFTFDQPAATRLYILENQPGDGLVYFTSEYDDPYIRQGYVKQAYVITDGKLLPANKTLLNTTSSWRKNDYKTTASLKVYDNIGDSSAAFTIAKGTVFHIYKIKVKNPSHLYGGISYFYIETSDGKRGWVKNPKKSFFIGRYDGTDDWNEYAFQWG